MAWAVVSSLAQESRNFPKTAYSKGKGKKDGPRLFQALMKEKDNLWADTWEKVEYCPEQGMI